MLKPNDLKKRSTSNGGQITNYSTGTGYSMSYNKGNQAVSGCLPDGSFHIIEPDHPDDAPKTANEAKRLFVDWANRNS